MVMKNKYSQLYIVFLLILLVHNLEEVLCNLPQWANAYRIVNIWTMNTFVLAVCAVWLLAFLLTIIFCKHKIHSKRMLYIMSLILCINAIQHIIFSIMTMSMMPGVVSSVVLIIPYSFILLRRSNA